MHLKFKLLIVFLAAIFNSKILHKILRGQEMEKKKGSGYPQRVWVPQVDLSFETSFMC